MPFSNIQFAFGSLQPLTLALALGIVFVDSFAAENPVIVVEIHRDELSF